MRMHTNFKKPLVAGEDSSDSGAEAAVAAELAFQMVRGSDSDNSLDSREESDSDSDFRPGEFDSDSSEALFEEDDGDEVETAQGSASGTHNAVNMETEPVPSTSAAAAALLDMNADEEEDETVRAIISAIKQPRSSPPEIKVDEFVTSISFHPERDIIALATITGDVHLYSYANEGNTLLRSIEVHTKSCRDVQFSDDGCDLLTCSKDKSIMVTDMQTEQLKQFYDAAHDEPINKLYVIDEHLFATGDDGGTVKLFDLRTQQPIFALKEVEDYISQMLTNDAKKLLLVTSGDGYLTTLNIGARKLYVQSEPYEEDLTCMGLFRGDSKLVVGSAKGHLYTYNWGQFGLHCDMFPGLKSTIIGEMIPITDRIACVAGEDGVIRACHIAPFRILGVVGQHNMPVECLDVSNTGELIASSSHNNDVRFWNVKYFEDLGEIKYNEKHNTYKESRHNLPSSKYANAADFFGDLAKQSDDNNAADDDDDDD